MKLPKVKACIVTPNLTKSGLLLSVISDSIFTYARIKTYRYSMCQLSASRITYSIIYSTQNEIRSASLNSLQHHPGNFSNLKLLVSVRF